MVYLAGCESGPPASMAGPPKTNADDVLVLKHPPKQPYLELGLVRTSEIYDPASIRTAALDVGASTGVHTRLREAAAARGADAVILIYEYVVNPSDETATASSRIFAEGMAIHFTNVSQNAAKNPAAGQPSEKP